jgi:hypothetical protein
VRQTDDVSTTVPQTAPTAALADIAPPRAWQAWAGGLLSAVLLAAILVQLRGASAEPLKILVHLPAAAWPLFAATYLAQPLADWVIFHRLWKLRLGGLAETLRKTVLNEIVFGYSGEAWFYLWARRHRDLSDAPFGAIKDVNILSALVGNVVTLAVIALSVADARGLELAHRLGPALWLGVVVVAAPIAVLPFGRRVFSLPRRELGFVAGVHLARVGATCGLLILLWRVALPAVPLGALAVLLAVRLTVSRLPLITNKELVFGNLLLVLVGSGTPVAGTLAALAVATLGAHLATLAAIGSRDLVRLVQKRSRR